MSARSGRRRQRGGRGGAASSSSPQPTEGVGGFAFAPPADEGAGAGAGAGAADAGAAEAATGDVTKMLLHADGLVERGEVEAGLQFYEAALAAAPDAPEVLDAYGSFLLEEGEDMARGVELLQRSVELAPDAPDGFGKYMSLGQIASGVDAVQYFEAGAALIQARLLALQQELEARQQHAGIETEAFTEEAQVLRIALGAAYCQCAELYLTDLCFEDGAEQRCEELVTAALAASQDGEAGPYRLLADLRISQQRNEEALAALQTCFSFWRNAEEIDDRPAAEVRDSCGKMFIELGYPGEALEIYEQLLDEDDSNFDAFYMLAVTHKALGDLATAHECATRAQEILAESGIADSDPAVVSSVAALLSECAESANASANADEGAAGPVAAAEEEDDAEMA
jgi:tetratricopeptide (TPR) repeat protein